MNTETALPPGRAGDEDPARRAILADLFEALDAGGRATAPELLDTLRSKHPGHEQTITRLYAAAIEYERLCAALPGGPAPGAPRLLPGDTLGDFTVESLLAVGGMSEVYRARQHSLGERLVALKVVPASVTDGGGRARLRREALALAGLHHGSLVEVHGFGEQDGLLFYAMRLVEGPTLAQVLARASAAGGSTRAWRRAVVAWMADVADALACVHAADLVHRDVKPANVVLQGPPSELPCGVEALARLGGTAVLVDFGLARSMDAPAGTLTLHHAATPAYAAPEQLLGQPVDGRVDVFALGVSLHDLLATRLPGARAQASAGLPPLRDLLPDIDDDLAAVVARACDPQPRWRYPDAAALRDDLRAWLAGRGVSARRAPLPERAVRAARARPLRFAILTTVTLLAAGLLLAGAVVTSGARRSAGEAARAAERGDLLALQAGLRGVPPVLDGLLLDGPLAALAPRARGLDVHDPLRATCTRLQLGDTDGALREAVTALRVSGPAQDPVLVRFLEATLALGPQGEDGDHRHAALLLAARLFVERPVLDDDAQRACAALRQRLLLLAADGSGARDDRRYALSALTGCAELDDTAALLDLTLWMPVGSEMQRLGLLAVEHAVRRAHPRGQIGRVDVGGLWARFSESLEWRQLLASQDDPLCWGMRVALTELTRSLAVAARAQGVRLDVSPLVGAVPDDGGDAAFWLRDEGVTTALAGSPGACAWARRPSQAPGSLEDVHLWGRLAGASNDAELVADAARYCAQLAGSDRASSWGNAFAQGVAESRAELVGIIHEVEPDPDTLLGVECQDAWIDTARLTAPPGAPGETTGGWTGIANWSFADRTPALAGTARGAGIRCTRWQQDSPGGSGYLRLGAFGRSEVRFEFEVTDDPGVQRWRFLVNHQLAARRYLPYQGRAMVLVRIDENAGTTSDMLTETGLHWEEFPIPADRLPPGPHVIRVLLQEDSTTTYRLYGAQLERPADD